MRSMSRREGKSGPRGKIVRGIRNWALPPQALWDLP